ncbi:sugar-binding transcriptional regulator [Lactobacillus selangorensis]|nr:sugar-binding transcriptional regulator [Lactobacillus selangorensis]
MKQERNHLLAKVAYLYYEQDYTQAQIAKELGIYRTTISRMLKQARDQHIVEIHIQGMDTGLFNLEFQIKNKYHLQSVVVIASQAHDSHQQKNQRLSQAAALHLKQIIKPHDIVGFSWGSVLAGIVWQLHNPTKTDATFVPLVGGPSPSNSQYHVNGIVYDMARQFGGKSLFVDAAAVQESKYVRDGIMNSHYFQEIRYDWDHLNIAMVGIGGPLSTQTSHWRDLLSVEDEEMLRQREAIGDCCCTFFDRYGKILSGDLLDRTIAIPLDQLQKADIRVGVARSVTKVPAIKALLKMGTLNSLITDEETAQRILA